MFENFENFENLKKFAKLENFEKLEQAGTAAAASPTDEYAIGRWVIQEWIRARRAISPSDLTELGVEGRWLARETGLERRGAQGAERWFALAGQLIDEWLDRPLKTDERMLFKAKGKASKYGGPDSSLRWLWMAVMDNRKTRQEGLAEYRFCIELGKRVVEQIKKDFFS